MNGEVRARGEVASRTEGMLYLGALSWAAAMIHALVAVPHLRESTPFGVLFVVLAAAQGVCGVLLYLRPTRALLGSGVLINAGALLVWGLSRSVGLPVGPGGGAPEPVGLADIGAVAVELAILIGLVLTLRCPRRAVRISPWARGLAIAAFVFAGAVLPTADDHRPSAPEVEDGH